MEWYRLKWRWDLKSWRNQVQAKRSSSFHDIDFDDDVCAFHDIALEYQKLLNEYIKLKKESMHKNDKYDEKFVLHVSLKDENKMLKNEKENFLKKIKF